MYAIAFTATSRSSTTWNAAACRRLEYERAMSNAYPVVWIEYARAAFAFTCLRTR